MVSRVYHGVTISVTYYIFLGRMCHKYCRCVFSLYNLNALSFILFAAVLHILKGEESYFAIDRGNMTTATLPILLLLLLELCSLITKHKIKISQLLSLVSRAGKATV